MTSGPAGRHRTEGRHREPDVPGPDVPGPDVPGPDLGELDGWGQPAPPDPRWGDRSPAESEPAGWQHPTVAELPVDRGYLPVLDPRTGPERPVPPGRVGTVFSSTAVSGPRAQPASS